MPIWRIYLPVSLVRDDYWQVDGFATMACGGTHSRTTREIGTLALMRRNPGKGKERIEAALA